MRGSSRKRPETTTARRRVLALSPEGQARLEAARPAWREAQRRVRAELGHERVEGVLGELRALLGAVRP